MATTQVPSHLLCLQLPPEKFQFTSTEELEDITEPLGQQRAIEALKFGTEMRCLGYNIFALGPPRIGKHQIVRQFLQKKASSEAVPSDWVYVNNFSDPTKPIAINFPPGHAKLFRQDVRQFIDDLRTTIPSIYESERYNSRRDSLIKDFKEQQEKALEDIQERAKKENVFLLTSRGAFFFGQGDESGNLINQESLDKLPKEEQKKITDRLTRYNDELTNIINNFPIQERQLRIKIKDLNREMLSHAVDTLAKDLIKKFLHEDKISDYLQKMIVDIVENARNFRSSEEERFEHTDGLPSPLKRYEVNIIVDHTNQNGAPVVFEDTPTFMNLVGQIEHTSQMGALITDFTLIKPGALHRANGGYLIVDAVKLLTSPYAWEGLKRALRSEDIRIESLSQVFSLIATVSLKPETIPLNCKIILIGEPQVFNLLVQFDPDFADLFKVSADFETEMIRNPENEYLFVRYLSSLIRKYGLLHLDASGASRILTHSTRLTEDSERLSISLDLISNLLKESDLFARGVGKKLISSEDVQKAIDAQNYRVNRIYEKIIDEIERGTLLIDVDGHSIGQVNGLSVFEFGNRFFGHPARITAVARMGDGGVVDIEREIKMGGPIHSKGVLILSGFLKARFAADVPLSISASLVFEQSYGFVEGDSASLAELCALLSTLSQFPLQQSIAITGSVNQHGLVQPVGAINEKIEGFFDYCSRKGLTERQGVVIPKANVKHLALRQNVIDAVAKSKFHIYSVDTIDDCMELLTGESSQLIHEKIESRLRAFAEQLRTLQKHGNLTIKEDDTMVTRPTGTH
ncbi:MAG: Lon protease family protein [Pseudobdellovibrionaceae bacterium]